MPASDPTKKSDHPPVNAALGEGGRSVLEDASTEKDRRDAVGRIRRDGEQCGGREKVRSKDRCHRSLIGATGVHHGDHAFVARVISVVM